MKSILLASAAAVGLIGFGTDSAEAQWGYRSGHSHRGYDSHDYRGDYRSRGYDTHYRGGYYRPHYHWHDTSHYDWHAPSIQRHGNHYHYTPGHYDFHRDGHWDRH